MTGSPCPKCGNQVMSFSDFVRYAEPHKTFACKGCGVALTRSAAVWVVIVVVAVAAALLGVLAGWSDLSVVWVAVGGVVAIVALTLLTKLIAYNLPLWRVKDPARPA